MSAAVVDGRFTRGKYCGKKVEEVLYKDPSYIHFAWCSGSNHFGITRPQWDRAKELMRQRGQMNRLQVQPSETILEERQKRLVEHLATTTRASREQAEQIVKKYVASYGDAFKQLAERIGSCFSGIGGLTPPNTPPIGMSTPLLNCRSVFRPVIFQKGDRIHRDGKTYECVGVHQDEVVLEEVVKQPSFLDDEAVQAWLRNPTASFLD